ncbi:FAD-dependent oxidoreductase [Streptomyces alboflavus]|uniref:FAD-dependent oxidoreductase n=1 Tax=Streptomyces alboflavus TaxID=67267 RepID=UPI0004C06630|nr:FAD-binding protein [Streptomyces alboflavus]
MGNVRRRSVLTITGALAGATAVEWGLPRSQAIAATGSANAGGKATPITVLPDDPRYPELTVGHNTRWVGTPDYVRLVRSTDEVVQAVRDAVRADKRVSVRSGGHCYADHVFNPDVKVVIDMTMMSAVSYDEERKAFAVEAGATLMDVYQRLYKGWGVGLPAGMCYSVGAGGHVTGGGFGLLSRQYGLTVDHLDAVEVVVVDDDGTVRSVVATRDEQDPHHDLWWAHTGGGGGNFGIVTRFWFRTPGASGAEPSGQLMRPPKDVLLSAVTLPWAELDKQRFTTLLRNYGTWHERNSAPDSPYAPLCGLLMLNHKANGNVGLVTQIDASVPDAEGKLKKYLSTITSTVGIDTQPMTEPVGEQPPLPDLFTPQRIPWLTSVRLIGTHYPSLTNPTLRGAYKSAYQRKGFTGAQIASLYQHLTRSDHKNPMSNLILFPYGGKVSEVKPSETATAQRDSVFKALFSTQWTGKSGDTDNVTWLREIFTDVYSSTGGYPAPNASTDGCYVNYQDSDITDPKLNTSGVPWHTLYYKDHYPRLTRVKAKYDPKNVFRHAQSVQLPTS